MTGEGLKMLGLASVACTSSHSSLSTGKGAEEKKNGSNSKDEGRNRGQNGHLERRCALNSVPANISNGRAGRACTDPLDSAGLHAPNPPPRCRTCLRDQVHELRRAVWCPATSQTPLSR